MLLDLCCLTCVGADYAVDSSSADAVVDYFGAGSVSGYYGSCSSGKESAELSGKSTCTPTVNNGAVTIKIINKTNITSTKGVTLISLIGSFEDFRFNLNAILNYC